LQSEREAKMQARVAYEEVLVTVGHIR
jgi:hypothetical protein